MATMIERVGDRHRICRRMSGAIQAERWNDDDGKWEYIESLTNSDATRQEEREAIEGFKRRTLT